MRRWMWGCSVCFSVVFTIGSGCKDNCGNLEYRCHNNAIERCQSDEWEPDGYWVAAMHCGDYGATCMPFDNPAHMEASHWENHSPPPDSPVQCIVDSEEMCSNAAEGERLCLETRPSMATCGEYQGVLLPVVTQFRSESDSTLYCVESSSGNAVLSYYEASCENGKERCYTDDESLRCEENVWMRFETCYGNTTCRILVPVQPDRALESDAGADPDSFAEEDPSAIAEDVECVPTS